MTATTNETLRAVVHSADWIVRRPAARTRSIAGIDASFPTPTRQRSWGVAKIGHDLGGERPAIGDALRHLRSDDVVWDIGAGWGRWGAFLGQVAAQVVAVDPDAERAAVCRQTLADNGVDADVRQVALGDGSEGTPASDLIADGVPAPDMVKIDVEGAEQAVLDGFGDALDRVRVVYAEPHDSAGGVSALRVALSEAGFAVAPIAVECHNPILRGVRE